MQEPRRLGRGDTSGGGGDILAELRSAVISGVAAAGLYRAFGAVMSVLRTGYVLHPLGAKLRCAAGSGTFFMPRRHGGVLSANLGSPYK